MTTLPNPRSIITSIFNTLPSTLPPSTTNPLKALPQSHRALLTTLHVLFPPGMLLQALDLLDRGLVTKIIYSSGDTSPDASTKAVPDEDDAAHLKEPGIGEDAQASMYKVQSSQSQHHKSRFSATATATTTAADSYTVHLYAWNCSCAAFVFSAFPATYMSASAAPWAVNKGDSSEGHGDSYYKDDLEGSSSEQWEFGGMGIVREGEGVPVCKHLLACVLGERWEGVMGGFVNVRRVGREEMAGLGGEG